MKVLLVVSNPRLLAQLMGIADAANSRGHKVTVFFIEESVKLLAQYPVLGRLGVDLIACQTACLQAGLGEGDLVGGARVSSLAELVVLMESSDRVLFLG